MATDKRPKFRISAQYHKSSSTFELKDVISFKHFPEIGIVTYLQSDGCSGQINVNYFQSVDVSPVKPQKS